MLSEYTIPKVYKVCEYFVLGFGAWTILSHIVVFINGNLTVLISLFGIFIVTLLGFAFIRQVRASDSEISRSVSKQSGQQKIIWLLVVIALVLTLGAHRPDADDSRYLNSAVAMADSPEVPILQYSSEHGVANVPLRFTSKLYANESFIAALSLLTGIPVIYLFHWLFAACAAILLVFAYATVFIILIPRYWLYAVIAVMVFLSMDGAVHRSFGNFAFVRLHQGKGMLVSVCIPLIIAFALSYSQQPTTRNWLLLACAQIVAVGMSSTGIMIAPVVAWLTLVIGFLNFKTGFKQFIIGATSSLYVLCLAAYHVLWPYWYKYFDSENHVLKSVVALKKSQTDPAYYEQIISYVYGDGGYAVYCVFIVALTWLICRTRLSRIFCIVFPCVVLLVFVNPIVDQFIATNITGIKLYWRVLWILPLPVMAALLFTMPLLSNGSRLNRITGAMSQNQHYKISSETVKHIIFFIVLSVYVLILHEQSIFAPANRVSFSWPRLKVTPEYTVSKAIVSSVAGGSHVLAPEKVSTWIPTFHHPPYPLAARKSSGSKLGHEQKERMLLSRYIDGGVYPNKNTLEKLFISVSGRTGRIMQIGRISPDVMKLKSYGKESKTFNAAQRFLAAGLLSYDLSSVCLHISNPWGEEIRDVLIAFGYKVSQIMLDYEIWTK